MDQLLNDAIIEGSQISIPMIIFATIFIVCIISITLDINEIKKHLLQNAHE